MTRAERRRRALDLMDRLELDALVLHQPANFAWFTGGGDNRVDHSSPVGVALAAVTRDREVVLADNIEADRIAAEAAPGIEVVSYPWFEGPATALAQIVGDGRVAGDAPVPVPSFLVLPGDIARLRWVLDDDALQQYRAVGQDAAEALEEASAALVPGMTELDAAAEVLAACRRRALFCPVVLAAGDDRIARFRHPLPTGATFHRRVMLVACAERHGLYANLTTFVHFQEPEADWVRRQEATEGILQRIRDLFARPGATLGEVFAGIERSYREMGYPDEWKFHHQGGTTGYATREVVATPGSDIVIEEGMAFAWNPSIAGAKAEETFVLTGSGPEVVARASL